LSTLFSLIAAILHLALMLAAAPLLVGWLRLSKARLMGRTGPKLLQPYRDLIRLSRKRPVLA
jgi:formate hydrogenlyase subunit 4